MARLDATIDEFAYDDILADTTPAAFVTTVKLAASEKALPKGTVLVCDTADGQFKAASEALKATDTIFILAEDVEKAEADDVVGAYKSGNFYRNRLVGDGEYELAAADFETLRKSGYLTKDVIENAGSEEV